MTIDPATYMYKKILYTSVVIESFGINHLRVYKVTEDQLSFEKLFTFHWSQDVGLQV